MTQQTAMGSTTPINDEWLEVDKLTVPDNKAEDLFGNSVSIDGDYAIIGTPYDDDNGIDSGSAYIFKRNGTSWNVEAKLLASDGGLSDSFGWSVSIDDNYVLIGAPGDGLIYTGSAYIFKRDGTEWIQKKKLQAPDGGAYDKFGVSVSIRGNTAVVGAEQGFSPTRKGSAYIFERYGETWIQEAKLQGSDSVPWDYFGCSVSIYGDYAIVGAGIGNVIFPPYDGIGSAYVFKYDGINWIEEAKIQASDGESGELFGCSVSIFGDYAIIGALYDDDYGDYTGSAYIFKRDGTNWIEKIKLIASDAEPESCFGSSVSIKGDYAIVGAYIDGDLTGSAYIFKYNETTWNEEAKIIASDVEYGDSFGWSVSIDGDYAIIGSVLDDDNGYDSGAAYIFGKNIQENIPPTKPTITGPTSGSPGDIINYSFKSTDPEGEQVYYWIEWGDGTVEEWLGPYKSGMEIFVSHSWAEKGTYTVKAKAKDIWDAESDWGYLDVTMPKNYNQQATQQTTPQSSSSYSSSSSSSSSSSLSSQTQKLRKSQ